MPVSELSMSSGPESMVVKGMKITVPLICKAGFTIFALVIWPILIITVCEKQGGVLTVLVQAEKLAHREVKVPLQERAEQGPDSTSLGCESRLTCEPT